MSGGALPVQVEHARGEEYTVRIGDRTVHTVRAPAASLQRVQRADETAESAIERVVRYLLDREPPESILRRFAVDDVARYFPSFWSDMAATRGDG